MGTKENEQGRRGVRIAGLAIALALLAAGSAQAATVTIGPSLATAPTATLGADIPLTLATVAPALPANGSSPVDGTVVSWETWTEDEETVALRILRPSGTGSMSFTGAGTGPSVPTRDNLRSGPFPISLPIGKGDIVGLDNPAPGTTNLRGYQIPGATLAYWNPRLADGGAPAAPSSSADGIVLAVSATVRYCVVPKLKGKSPKKARKALRAADCTVGKVKKAKKETKKKRVLKQGVAPGTSISDTQPVPIKVSRRAK